MDNNAYQALDQREHAYWNDGRSTEALARQRVDDVQVLREPGRETGIPAHYSGVGVAAAARNSPNTRLNAAGLSMLAQ